MRSRRVPVLKLGSRGPGGDARSLRCVRKASASVRKASAKRSQAFASVRGGSDMPERRKRLSSLFTFRLTKVSTVTGIAGVVVAKPTKPRTVSTFGLVLRIFITKVSTVTGIAGVVVTKPRTIVTFGLVLRFRVSKVSTVTGIREVGVAKPRTVVTFGLASGLRVSKVSTVTGIAGGRGREAQNCRHFWPCLWREERREEGGEKRDERREER